MEVENIQPIIILKWNNEQSLFRNFFFGNLEYSKVKIMNDIKKWNKWANVHSYFIIDLLRVMTGVFMLYKGFSFMSNPNYYDYFANELSFFGGGILLIHIVVSLNVIGGIMIIVGFLTRWVIFIQLPIVIGAATLNITGKMQFQNFAISIFILSVFVFFAFFGSGKHSADYYFKMHS